MAKQVLVAVFDQEEHLVTAAQEIVKQGAKIFDCYTPFPVHGLDELLEIKRSFLPYVTLVAGLTGALFALALQIYVSAISWPINIGGKPFFSLPSFIPVTFELTILFGALATVKIFFLANKLFPGKTPSILFERATDDRFILAIEKNPFLDEGEKWPLLLKEARALSVETKTID